MAEEKTASAKLVDSVALTLTARVAMIVALPVACWMGNRLVATADEISKKLDLMKEASDRAIPRAPHAAADSCRS
jgi:hypothetical protein